VSEQRVQSETPHRLWRLGVYAGRLVAAAGVVALGIWTLAGLGALTDRTPAPQAEPAEPPPEAPVPSAPWLAALDFPGGGWTFAGLPWRLSVERLPRAAADARLLLPPRGTVPDGPPSDAAREMLTLVKSIGAARKVEDGYAVYVLKLGDGGAALFTNGTGSDERPILGRVAQGSGDASVLIEAVPLPLAQATAQKGPDLLPLPAGAQRLATRHRADGTVLAELVTVDAGVTALREEWRRSGYRMQDVKGKAGAIGIICRQQDSTVQAWLCPRVPNDTGERTLVFAIALPAGGTQ
jgi:hypothetical protein